MAKGGQIPEIKLAKTQIGEFDDFFEEAKDPLATIVGWNNGLDENTVNFRKLGSDLRKYSSKDAPPSIGDLKVTIEDGMVVMVIEKDGAPVKKFDKITSEYVKVCQTKVKKLNTRLKAIRKKENLADAAYKLGEKGELLLVAEKLGDYEEEDYIVDAKRSVLKFNDRSGLLDLQLKGPVSLGEAVSGFFGSLKDELKKKQAELSIAISDEGLPTIEGLPDDLEDFLPSILVRAYKLFMAFIESIKTMLAELPELGPKIEALVEQAQEFPGKAQEAASSAGLTGMAIPKAVKAVGGNVKTLAGAPPMVKTLGDTLKDTVLQLANAATGNKAEQ